MKASAMLGDKIVDETRMTTEHRASPQTAQGVSFVVARYVFEAFDKDFQKLLRGMSARTQSVIATWMKWRTDALGNLKDQTRPVMVAVLQETSVSPRSRRNWRTGWRIGW